MKVTRLEAAGVIVTAALVSGLCVPRAHATGVAGLFDPQVRTQAGLVSEISWTFKIVNFIIPLLAGSPPAHRPPSSVPWSGREVEPKPGTAPLSRSPFLPR